MVPPIEGEVDLEPVVFWMKRKNANDHKRKKLSTIKNSTWR